MLPASMPALGIFPSRAQPKTIALEDETVLFFFTDGCYEWETKPGEFFGLERFVHKTASLAGHPDCVLENLFSALGCAPTPRYNDDVSALRIDLRRADVLGQRENERPGRT